MNKIKIFCLLSSIFFSNFSIAAPDEESYGKLKGYPPGFSMGSDYSKHFRVGGFSGKQLEKPGTEKTKIQASDKPIQVERENKIKWTSDINPDELIASNPIMALILIKDNKIVFESFQYDTGLNSTFNSESIAKTLTALVIGTLLDEGKIRSLGDRVDFYIPEFKEIPFGKNSIKNLLQMRCGLTDISAGPTGGRYANIKYGPTGGRGPAALNLYDYMQTTTTSMFIGFQYAYDPRCTDVLSMIISKVTGKLLAEVFEERIWNKIGAEYPAYWAKATNTDITSGANQFWAKPSDWAKVANLMVNKGSYNGQQIISEAYVSAMTKDVVSRESSGSYGYQTFTSRFDTSAWANGYLGQRIYFDSTKKSAMIVFAVDEHESKTHSFWNKFRVMK